MLFDHVFAVLLIAGLPVYAQLFYQWLAKRSGRGIPDARISVYRIGSVVQWLLVAVVAVRWVSLGRSWEELGLGQPAAGSAWYSILILFLAAASAVRVWNQISVDEEARQTIFDQLADLEALLPRTRRERDWAWVVSVTAGVCEEILFRGFLFWWLSGFLDELPAMGLVTLSFGLCHAYQGPWGILKTALVGAVFGALVLVTDALWLAIALHAFIDLNSLSLAHALLAEDESEHDFDFFEQAPLPTEGEFEDEGWGVIEGREGPDGEAGPRVPL